MSKNLPYFKWFPSDADTDEHFRSFTDEEIGFYIRCLNHAWLNNGLPIDSGHRARILKVTPKAMARLWDKVGRCFAEVNGRFVNPRQERERDEAKIKSDKASKSVRTRYERSTKEPLRAYESDYESESSDVQEGGSGGKPRPVPIMDEQWLELRAVARNVGLQVSEVDWSEAYHEWRRMDSEQKRAAIDGLEARAATDDPALESLPKNYLAKRMWQRKIRASATRKPTAAEQRDLETRRLLEEQIGGGG